MESAKEAPHPAATLALVAAVLSISFAAIFFREAAPTHPLVMSAVRLAIAAVLLLPVVVRARARGRLPAALLRRAVVAGLLYGLHFGAWVTSLMFTTVAASVTLVTATPLMLATAALLSGKDRPGRRHYGAIGLALLGVLLIGGADMGGDGRALAGDALAVLGAAAMAAYLLLVRAERKRFDVWAFSGVACAVGAASLALLSLALGVPLEVSSPGALLSLGLAALFPQIVGHGLLTWSLRHLRPTVVGMATVGEPVGSTLLAFVWLGEGLSLATALGCTLTLSAVLLSLWKE